MAVFRVEKNKNYTVMSNYHFKDKRISLKAKGLLSQMLSLPEDWDYTIRGLSSINKEGIDAIKSTIKELEDNGYIKRNQLRNEKGAFGKMEYVVFEEPQIQQIQINNMPIVEKPLSDNLLDLPIAENPLAVNPIAENPMQLNTNISNTKESSIKVSQSVKKDKIKNEENFENSIETKKDRQTDGLNSEPMKFSDILIAIGYDWSSYHSDEPLSEDYFSIYDESERKTNKCQIPFGLKTDKKAFSETLKFLFAYSYYTDSQDITYTRLLDRVISAISEMVEKDIQVFQKETVKYHQIIDIINDIVKKESLIEWFYSFEQEWNKILKENKIKNHRAYMKSCIWNWLNDYKTVEDNLVRSFSTK